MKQYLGYPVIVARFGICHARAIARCMINVVEWQLKDAVVGYR